MAYSESLLYRIIDMQNMASPASLHSEFGRLSSPSPCLHLILVSTRLEESRRCELGPCTLLEHLYTLRSPYIFSQPSLVLGNTRISEGIYNNMLGSC